MLDEQDLVKIEAVFDRKMSDTRHNVSNLQQDVTGLKHDVTGLKQKVSNIEHQIVAMREANKQNIGILVEKMKDNVQLILEGVDIRIKDALNPYREKVFENHETRISALETAVKKKFA